MARTFFCANTAFTRQFFICEGEITVAISTVAVHSRNCRTCIWRCVLASSLYNVTSPLFGVFLPCPPFWPHWSFLAITQIMTFFPVLSSVPVSCFLSLPHPMFYSWLYLQCCFSFFFYHLLIFPNYFLFIIKELRAITSLLPFAVFLYPQLLLNACWAVVCVSFVLFHKSQIYHNVVPKLETMMFLLSLRKYRCTCFLSDVSFIYWQSYASDFLD